MALLLVMHFGKLPVAVFFSGSRGDATKLPLDPPKPDTENPIPKS
jgi:hypothetical protein